jgi:hypothetical protein
MALLNIYIHGSISSYDNIDNNQIDRNNVKKKMLTIFTRECLNFTKKTSCVSSYNNYNVAKCKKNNSKGMVRKSYCMDKYAFCKLHEKNNDYYCQKKIKKGANLLKFSAYYCYLLLHNNKRKCNFICYNYDNKIILNLIFELKILCESTVQFEPFLLNYSNKYGYTKERYIAARNNVYANYFFELIVSVCNIESAKDSLQKAAETFAERYNLHLGYKFTDLVDQYFSNINVNLKKVKSLIESEPIFIRSSRPPYSIESYILKFLEGKPTNKRIIKIIKFLLKIKKNIPNRINIYDSIRINYNVFKFLHKVGIKLYVSVLINLLLDNTKIIKIKKILKIFEYDNLELDSLLKLYNDCDKIYANQTVFISDNKNMLRKKQIISMITELKTNKEKDKETNKDKDKKITNNF